jgi:hypothetical protein
VNGICAGLAFLFAFLVLAPHAPVHAYDYPTTARSSR